MDSLSKTVILYINFSSHHCIPDVEQRCCITLIVAELPLTPDGFMPRAPSAACLAGYTGSGSMLANWSSVTRRSESRAITRSPERSKHPILVSTQLRRW